MESLSGFTTGVILALDNMVLSVNNFKSQGSLN